MSFKYFLQEKFEYPEINQLDYRHKIMSQTAKENEEVAGEDSIKAMQEYKFDSRKINKWLRTKSPEHEYEGIDEHIDNLKKLTENPLRHKNHNLILYRGLSRHSNPHLLKPGTLLRDRGFTSTSLSSETAYNFASYIEPKDHADSGRDHIYIARIHVTPETKGHYLDHDDARHRMTHEKELILHPGTTFELMNRTTVHRKTIYGNRRVHYIDMKVHHQDD